MTTTDFNSTIINGLSRIGGKYNVSIGFVPESREITAEKFDHVGTLINFQNEAQSFMDSLNLSRYTVKTTYNPYVTKICWRR